MDVRERTTDREMTAAYPLARQLRDRIREEAFLAETAKGFYERSGFPFLTSIPCWRGTVSSG
jgi:hypothetical protein